MRFETAFAFGSVALGTAATLAYLSPVAHSPELQTETVIEEILPGLGTPAPAPTSVAAVPAVPVASTAAPTAAPPPPARVRRNPPPPAPRRSDRSQFLRPAVVRGQLLTESGRPIRGARVYSANQRPELEAGVYIARTRSDGRFEVMVEQGGSLALRFAHPSHRDHTLRFDVGGSSEQELGQIILP